MMDTTKFALVINESGLLPQRDGRSHGVKEIQEHDRENYHRRRW